MGRYPFVVNARIDEETRKRLLEASRRLKMKESEAVRDAIKRWVKDAEWRLF